LNYELLYVKVSNNINNKTVDKGVTE